MSKKIIGKVLSIVLSAAMVMTSVVPSYAAQEETFETYGTEVIEETDDAVSEETEEVQDSGESDTFAQETEESLDDQDYESEEGAEEELPEAEAEDIEEEVEEVAEEEALLQDIPDDGYTVIYDAGEGYFIDEFRGKQTNMYPGYHLYFPSPEDAIRPGYLLAGWVNNANETRYPYGDDTYFEYDTALTEDMCEGDTATFTAVWEEITGYEIMLDYKESGITAHPGEVYPDLPQGEARYGRYFEGWTIGSQLIVPGRTLVTAPERNYIRSERIDGATQHPYKRFIPVIRLESEYSMIRYTIVYHLNVGTKDIRTSANHTVSSSGTSLDVTRGDLSNNSSFNSEGFAGWFQSDGTTYSRYDTIRDVMMNNSPSDGRSVTVDLYALWDDSDMYYNIAFDANGGTGSMETIKAEFNKDVVFKNQFIRTGYRLVGLGTKKDGTGINYVPSPDDPDGNYVLYNITMNNHETVTLYAIWEPETQSVGFFDGDDLLWTEDVYYDGIVDPDGSLSDPVRFARIRKPGYVFKGWNLKDAEEKLIPVDLTKKKYDGSFTAVYAEYDPVIYTVTYHSNIGTKDCTAFASYTVEDEQYSTLDPEKITYTAIFGGNEDALAALEEHELSGWALDKGTLGAEFTEKELLTGCMEGSVNEAEVKVNAYATWKPEEPYNVIFVAGENVYDGSFPVTLGMASGQFYRGYAATLFKGESIVLSGNEFVKAGFKITGWTYMDGDKTVKVKPSVTLKDLPTKVLGEDKYVFVEPIWASGENSYKITYDQAGGKLSSGKLQAAYSYSTGYELPRNMFKAGYDFGGWFEDAAFTHEVKKLGAGGDFEIGNVTLYAKFTPAYYSLHLDPNRGGGADDIITINGIAYGQVVDLSNHQVSYAGRTFNKWLLPGTSKKYGANDKVKNLSAVSGEVTLVAQWSDTKHKITYDYSGGVKVKNPATYTTSAPVLITEPSRDGYEFDYWKVETKTDDGTYDIVPSEGKWMLSGTDSVTLTAVWAERYYDVEFYTDDRAQEPVYALRKLTFEDTVKGSDLARAAMAFEKAENGVKGFAKTSGAAKSAYDSSKDVKVSALCAKLELPAVGNTIVKLYVVYDSGMAYRYIMYMLDEGTGLSKNMFTFKPSAKAQALPQAVKSGYRFVRWTTGDEEYDKAYLDPTGTKIAGNTNADLYLIPEFEAKTYNVTIDFGGATDYSTGKSKAKITYKNVSFEDGSYQIPNKGMAIAKAPTNHGYRRGYTFMGYSTVKSALKGDIKPGAELKGLTDKSAVTLYAIWRVNTTAINFLSDVEVDGKDSDVFSLDTSSYTDSMVFGKKALTLPKPAKEGYTFLGWRIIKGEGADVNYDKTKTYVTKVNAGNTQDLILKACFAENTYYITINPNGGYFTEWGSGKYTNKAVKIPYPYRYTSDVTWITRTSSFSTASYREGYALKGMNLTFDKAGKKPATSGFGLTSKNNGNATLYLQWEKVSPSRITMSRATLHEGEGFNWLVMEWDYRTGDMLEVQYSISPDFRYGTYTLEYQETPPLSTKVAGDAYFVRMRRKAFTSDDKVVYGPWSETITAAWYDDRE